MQHALTGKNKPPCAEGPCLKEPTGINLMSTHLDCPVRSQPLFSGDVLPAVWQELVNATGHVHGQQGRHIVEIGICTVHVHSFRLNLNRPGFTRE